MITIAEAKQFLRDNFTKGAACPCCKQNVKKYTRKLNSGMARVLIELYAERSKGFIHVKDHLRENNIKNGHDWTLLEHWGMIRQNENIQSVASKESGYWSINLAGIEFVQGKRKAKGHVILYNKKCLGFSDKETTIQEALGNHFDYEELMSTN